MWRTLTRWRGRSSLRGCWRGGGVMRESRARGVDGPPGGSGRTRDTSRAAAAGGSETRVRARRGDLRRGRRLRAGRGDAVTRFPIGSDERDIRAVYGDPAPHLVVGGKAVDSSWPRAILAVAMLFPSPVPIS